MTGLRTLLGLWCSACLAGSAGYAADLPMVEKAQAAATLNERWSATIASEVRYFSWEGDRGTPAGRREAKKTLGARRILSGPRGL